jgi:anthranilate synthase/aminodeoxychorismate synthase-like glutamine amidotransferase
VVFLLAVIDNYDSFTYNLVNYFGMLGEEVRVWRNDRIAVPELLAFKPAYVVISPGPGTPERAGITLGVVKQLAGTVPILGVCLGHQAIAQAFGGRVVPAGRLMHGKTSPVFHDGRGIFRGLPSPFFATRYHSLLVEKESLPPCLEVSAWTEEGEIMGLRHRELIVEGVQFHPESILTEYGLDLFKNFLGCKSGKWFPGAEEEGNERWVVRGRK